MGDSEGSGGEEDFAENEIGLPDCRHRDGFLTKEGKIFKTWNKRFFVLKERSLYYFEKKV